MYYGDDDYFAACMRDELPGDYGSKNRGVPRDIHVMNKDEAKVMRRLKNETGLSEEEIRKVKKYRVMLSEAQKEGQKAKRTKIQKVRDKVMKDVCRKLKLPKEHPDVQKEYVEEWIRRRDKRGWGRNIYKEHEPFKPKWELKW